MALNSEDDEFFSVNKNNVTSRSKDKGFETTYNL